MKRDMELIRSILLDIEERKPAYECWDPKPYLEGKDAAVVAEHMNLLISEGYLTGTVDYIPQSNRCFFSALDLTWMGHEFLSLSRENRVWKVAKDKILDAGLAFSMPLLMEYLKNVAKKYLNLD